MQKTSIYIAKTNCLGILYIILIFFASSAIATTLKADNWLDEPISISFQNETLSKVLKQISEQTGVSIAYDQKLATEKVTGAYQGVKTSDAITRLFKSKNISIQVNTEKKVIIVKTFGAKNFIWASEHKGYQNSSKMTLAELEKIHAQQYKEYKDRIANDNEVLEDGITRNELKEMHKLHYLAYKKQISDANAILEDGLTRGELKLLQDKQHLVYRKHATDMSAPIEDGITRGELISTFETQDFIYKKNLKDVTTILADDTMTRTQIHTMQKEQYEKYKNSNKATTYVTE